MGNYNKNSFFRKYLKHILLFKLILITIIVLLFYFLVLKDPKKILFPQLENNQKSPKAYITKEVSASQLPMPEVIEHGPRDKKEIAITFDADMTYGMLNLLQNGQVKSWFDKRIIDFLTQEKVKATIFMAGLWVKAYPKEAKEIAQNPLFDIGNHSYSHPAFTVGCYGLPVIDKKFDEDEVENAQNEIIKATGIIPMFFRFPGGCYENINVNTITRLGLKIVHWDVVSGDAFNNDTNYIVKNVESKVQNGSIIVLHLNGGQNAPKTYEALKQFVPYLQKQGYRFVKLSDFISQN